MNVMDLPVIQADGNPSGTVAVDDAVFGVPFKEPLVHQVVTAYLAGGRAGTSAACTGATAARSSSRRARSRSGRCTSREGGGRRRPEAAPSAGAPAN